MVRANKITKEQLLEIKQKIEKSRKEFDQLIGERKALMSQLKKEFGCDNYDAAEDLIEKWNEEMTDLQEKLDKSTEELIKKYPNLFS